MIKSSRRLHLYHLCCVKKWAALCGNIKLVTCSGGWYLSWPSRMYLGREDSSLRTTVKTCLKKPLCVYNRGAGVSAFTDIVWLYHSNVSIKSVLYSSWWAVIAHHRHTTHSHYTVHCCFRTHPTTRLLVCHIYIHTRNLEPQGHDEATMKTLTSNYRQIMQTAVLNIILNP